IDSGPLVATFYYLNLGVGLLSTVADFGKGCTDIFTEIGFEPVDVSNATDEAMAYIAEDADALLPTNPAETKDVHSTISKMLSGWKTKLKTNLQGFADCDSFNLKHVVKAQQLL
ncbi:UNVERIFIED_CONTAM: hypothetical protein HDU68_002879, partial [Siphonaria sp. JEL0065]